MGRQALRIVLGVAEPSPGRVLVRMQASGLCHTDIHAAIRRLASRQTRRSLRGTRASGLSRDGPGASLHKVNVRVAIMWARHAETAPTASTAGRRCASRRRTAATRWRRLGRVRGCPSASHVDARFQAVSSFDAAPLACAGVTTFKAVKVSRIQPGETAVIFGVGGLGHLGLRVCEGWWPGDRRRHRGREAGPSPAARCRLRGERPDDRPGQGHPGPQGCRRRRQLRHSVAGSGRAGRSHRCAAALWLVCRGAPGGRQDDRPDHFDTVISGR